MDKMEVKLLWHHEPGVSVDATNTTPLLKDGYIYCVNLEGEFYCVEAETGKIIWKSNHVAPLEHWSTVHIVQNENRSWIYTEAGELIIAELSPEKYTEISRAKIIKPTHRMGRRKVAWAHPAFANGKVYVKNDEEMVCINLKK